MKSSNRMWRRAASILILATALTACGDDDSNNTTTNNTTANNTTANNTTEGVEVVGTWDTQFDSTEVIDADAWNGSEIIEYSNADNWAVLQSPPDDMFTPDQFSRVVWTDIEGDVFYYCTVEFGLETAQEAIDSMATADDSDPANTGCGMFAWTMMTRVP